VHAVLPESIDDPAQPSGGNVYDRRVCRELHDRGWDVVEHLLPGWPEPDDSTRHGLAAVLRGVDDGQLVLVDGLLASQSAEVLAPVAERLRLVVVVHLPRGGLGEASALALARVVVTTSEWTRSAVAAWAGRVVVATPGTDPAPLASGTLAGDRLLYVGAVTPVKGADLLLSALGRLGDRHWSCHVAGPLDRDRRFVAELRDAAGREPLAGRVTFLGALDRCALDELYAVSDLLVVPSRAESYGMAVTEALARGIPVVAADVGGVREALGVAKDEIPGLLVPAGDADGLADALGQWLADATLRARLRATAALRRGGLAGWSATADAVEQALLEAAA
jgi:glycosyltransferase involved in cell wall biosynthesis